MNVSLMQSTAAIVMASMTFALGFAYLRYLARDSERQTLSVLQAVGLNPASASSGDIANAMKDVRRRCRSCASEDVCERWLRGDKKGGNEFCPNSVIFEALANTAALPSGRRE